MVPSTVSTPYNDTPGPKSPPDIDPRVGVTVDELVHTGTLFSVVVGQWRCLVPVPRPVLLIPD